jgi:hypothetical protein
MQRIVACILLVWPACFAIAQQPPETTAAQRDAMRKLSFLAGNWSGPVTILRGPGQALDLTQSERVEFKLDGLVLVIEGQSTATDGSVPFLALATVAYDDASHAYRLRAYQGGHYVDAELNIVADGFSWGFDAGPAHIANAMHLTPKGEWQESSEISLGGNPPRPTVRMLLTRQP